MVLAFLVIAVFIAVFSVYWIPGLAAKATFRV